MRLGVKQVLDGLRVALATEISSFTAYWGLGGLAQDDLAAADLGMAVVRRLHPEVWVMSWDYRADETAGPAVGLSVRAVVEVAAHLESRPGFVFRRKFGPVARYAAGRPLA